MTFKSVFCCLQDVFPQVDLRILKAVAIEHSKDVDAAVEFVLSEVLPCISESRDTSYTLDNAYDMEHSLASAGINKQDSLLGHQGAKENRSLLPEPLVVCESTFSDIYTHAANAKSSCMEKSEGKGSHIEHVGGPNKPSLLLCPHEAVEVTASPSSQAKLMEDVIDLIFDHTINSFHSKPHSLDEIVMDTTPSNIHVHDHLSNAAHRKAVDLVEQIVEPSQGLAKDECVSFDGNVQELYRTEANSTVTCVGVQAQHFSSSILEDGTDIMESGAAVEKDMNGYEGEHKEQLSRCLTEAANIQDLCDLEVNHSVVTSFTPCGDISSSNLENSTDSVKCETGHVNTDTSISEFEKQQPRCLTENDAELLAFENKMASVGDNCQSSMVATQSGQDVNINFLKDFILDAKNSKKTLASALESVINMVKAVELHEERAKQAKEEVIMAGQDILTKVEDLKQMVKHAQESNDKRAGEVYHEKSILTTEVQELQSRLINMSDERNKSLLILDKIRQNLEARLAAAEEARARAEQEKLEKEELARQVLNEEATIMMTVEHESRRLQQEAEENSKLREFLMDRGRILDILQGEIAVICENVLLFKERVDGHASLNKSKTLLTCSSASSTSSLYNKRLFSDQVLHPPDRESSRINEKSSENELLEGFVCENHDASLDDDWEICDA
ncbi:uncharacterized protein [Elaeis guineensis]|uniref:Uncharacterized protein LOC105052733 n=1 Tax=Elaeis guineensis var. tenera TaxID=51953 RepID=A0A6I9RU91_ELAGV|nr:uncharacterized protein LOC105052733 [Elaeis guineensis]XP_010931962.1 uncharacterized protein LOC105052733 [Elaeis guineensis]